MNVVPYLENFFLILDTLYKVIKKVEPKASVMNNCGNFIAKHLL